MDSPNAPAIATCSLVQYCDTHRLHSWMPFEFHSEISKSTLDKKAREPSEPTENCLGCGDEPRNG